MQAAAAAELDIMVEQQVLADLAAAAQVQEMLLLLQALQTQAAAAAERFTGTPAQAAQAS